MGEEKANFIARLLLNNKNNKTSVAIAKNFFYGEKHDDRLIDVDDIIVYPKFDGTLNYGKVLEKFKTYEWKLAILDLDGVEEDIPYRIAKLADDEQNNYYKIFSCKNFNN